MHYGATDTRITGERATVEAALQQTGKPYQIVVHEGAGHAFFNDTRPDAYRPAVAADAWPRAVGFLRARLAG